MATHSGTLTWRIPVDRAAWRVTESDTTEWLSAAQRSGLFAVAVILKKQLAFQ